MALNPMSFPPKTVCSSSATTRRSRSPPIASHREFADRKGTRWFDGDTAVSDGWASDFRLAEIQMLGAIQPLADWPQQNNNLYKVVTLQQVTDLAKAQSIAKRRTISVDPETKNPIFHRDFGVRSKESISLCMRQP